jgi:hypothetical protein
MDESRDRSGRSVAKGIGGLVLAVILVNVLVRVVPLPDLDLSTLSPPDVPGWLEAIVKGRKWVKVAGVIVVIVVWHVARHGLSGRSRSRRRSGAHRSGPRAG